MKSFTVYDRAGNIVKLVHCAASEIGAQLASGESYIEGECDVIKDLVDPVTRRLVKGGARVAPETHDALRRKAYPPIGDQLDMLWHAMKAGTLPKVEPFFSQIQAVKDAYPK